MIEDLLWLAVCVGALSTVFAGGCLVEYWLTNGYNIDEDHA